MNTINSRISSEMRRSRPAPRPSFGVNRASDLERGRVSSSSVISSVSRRIKQDKIVSTAKSELVEDYIIKSKTKSKDKKRKLSFTKLSISLGLFIVCAMTLAKGSDIIINKFVAKSDSASLQSRVAGLIKLKDANPKIYKVGDVAPLKEKSAFYEAIMPGDYVLVYNEDQKVLIYRESANLIVNIDSVSNL